MGTYGNAFGGGGGGAGAANFIDNNGYAVSSSGVSATFQYKASYSSLGGSGSPVGESALVGGDTITTAAGRPGGAIVVFANGLINIGIDISSFGRRQLSSIKRF